MKEVYDPFRKSWVAATPEEIVRQQLLHRMTSKLGYPLELLVIERELSQMPHLQNIENLPKRRIDLACFMKQGDQLLPLLMIECKAVPLTNQVKEQVIGYNHYMRAPYVGIANQKDVLTGSFNSQTQEYQFYKQLPPYESLVFEYQRT